MHRWLLIVGLCISLSACGFHLRGSLSPVLPADTLIFIDAPPKILNQLQQELPQDQLRDRPQQATVTLRVSNEHVARRVLSVHAKTGKERETELIYSVFFMLIRTHNSVLLPRQRVRIVRDLLFNANTIIAQSEEEATLQHQMRRLAMRQIVRRVQYALSQ